MRRSCRCHGEHAGARAHIENSRPNAADAHQSIEREQTAPCRRMFACAESGRSVDEEADAPFRYFSPMMRAVNEKTADYQRLKARLIGTQPVRWRNALPTRLRRIARKRKPGKRQPGGDGTPAMIWRFRREAFDAPSAAGLLLEGTHRAEFAKCVRGRSRCFRVGGGDGDAPQPWKQA